MATLVGCSGFEFGTTAGIATGTAGSRLFDAVTGTVTVTTSTPNNGTYCLQIDTTNNNALTWDTNTLGASKTVLVVSYYMYISTAPTAGTETAHIDTAGHTDSINIEYFNSTGKLRVFDNITATQVDSTTVLSNATWYRIDLRINVVANPWVIDWQINGVAQTQFSPANAATTIADFKLGNKFATVFSGVFRYDDLLASVTTGDYPLGAHKVVLAQPDTTLPTVLNGTAANFNTFSGATPTLTAWNATTAMTNLSELPVTTTTSQNGIAQITIASSDNVEIPMTKYQLLSGESVMGGRSIVVGWEASAASATLGIRSWNGVTETTLMAATAFSNLGNNTATPAWLCRMLTLSTINQQAFLNNLATRVGFSTDVTPNIGVAAAYNEIAIATGGAITGKSDINLAALSRAANW